MMRNIPHKALVAFLGLFPFSLSAHAQTLTEWKTLLGEPDIRSISFSHDGKLLAAGAWGTLVIWSVESGKEVRRLSGHTQAVLCVSFSPDGKLLASAGEDQTVKIWSSETWQELRSLPHSGTVRDVSFSPDGKLLASGGTGRTIRLQLDETEKDRGQTIKIWSTQTWKERQSPSDYSTDVRDVSFSPDGTLLAGCGEDGTMRIWTVETGKEIRKFSKGSSTLSFSPDGTLLATSSLVGSVSILSIQEGIEIRRLSGPGEYRYAVVRFSPDGKFLAGGNYSGTINKGFSTITLWSTESWTHLETAKKASEFATVDLSFSPDGNVLASVAGQTDWVTIWRLQPPPEIVLISPSSNRSVTLTGAVKVVALIKNVQDESNVQMKTGQRGLQIAPAKEITSEGIVLSWEIDVLSGSNEFEITAENGIGKASKTFVVSSSGPPSKSEPKSGTVSATQVWAVVIGISQYRKSEISLKYADRDAQAFFAFLRSPQGGGLSADHISLLLNENATRESIIKTIGDKLNRAFEDDMVIIYIACHGMPDPVGNEVYFLGYDAKPENLAGTAVSQIDIEKALTRTRAKKKLWIADACHSGGVGLGVRGNYAYLTNKLLIEIAASKEGLAMLTASSASEFSKEDERWGGGHGVFTHFLIRGLQGGADNSGDGIVSVRELYEYVYRGVAEETGGQQHPELKGTFDNKMPVSVVK